MKRTITAGLVLALALTGCSDDKKPAKAKPGSSPPAPSAPPEKLTNAAPGAKQLKTSKGLRKPVVYTDKISVSITGIRYVKDKEKGRGVIKGQLKTIFTLRFSNGSPQPLDLNRVRVVARYGPKRATAQPVSYADINDFFGSVPTGQKKTASYAFELPYPQGYKNVVLGVKFDEKHKAAVFAGSLKP